MDYPLSREIHLASWLQTGDDVAAWNDAGETGRSSNRDELDGTGEGFPPVAFGFRWEALTASWTLLRGTAQSLGECIRSRGFDAPILHRVRSRGRTSAPSSTPLGTSVNAPHLAEGFSPYLSIYLIVNAVDGPGPRNLLLQPFLQRPAVAQGG